LTAVEGFPYEKRANLSYSKGRKYSICRSQERFAGYPRGTPLAAGAIALNTGLLVGIAS
jgi:hypothetical protein